MEHLTIRDIARMAGVSPTAVSFVLNNKKGVSDETRLKIQEIIQSTGFTPNVHTRRLNLKKSFNVTLGIKQNVSAITNIFYLEILLSILDESKYYEYNIVLSDITDTQSEKRLLSNIRNNDTDGIIFIQDPSPYLITETQQTSKPFIIVDTQDVNCPHTTVRVDYAEAARVSVEYLISKGHRSIAFFGMEVHPSFYLNAFNGYKQALEDADLSFMPNWIQPSAYDEQSSYECMKTILNGASIPTAIFCSSDMFAFGSMKCANDKGYKIPDDISFIGIDDVMLSKYSQPALTTLSIDEDLMGRSAMRLIDIMIHGEPYESIVLSSTTIIERDSVKDLNAAE